MGKFNLRLLVLFVSILLQTSFLVVLFPEYAIPNLVITVAIAWTINASFEVIWPWVVFLGLGMDLFTFSVVGKNVIFLILVAYVVSFLSRRFLVETRISGFLVTIFFIFGASLASNVWDILWMHSMDLVQVLKLNQDYILSAKNFAIQFLFNVIIFYIIFWILSKIEKKISFYEQKVKL